MHKEQNQFQDWKEASHQIGDQVSRWVGVRMGLQKTIEVKVQEAVSRLFERTRQRATIG